MPLEEGTKVASGIVEALKSQPLVLALILVNLVTLGYVFIQQRDRSVYEREINDKLISCVKVSDFIDLKKSIGETLDKLRREVR